MSTPVLETPPASSMPRPWHTRLSESAVTQFFVALLCIGVPFVLSNVVVRFFPAGADMAHLRNGFKIAVLVAAYLGYVRWVEKRSPFELSLQGALKETGLGFLLGAGLISLSVALMAAFGSYQVDGFNAEVTWFRYVAGFFAVAMLEELIFRAVLFRLIEKSLGSVIAITLSTALFGLVHLVNPNATWISTASLTLSSLILVASFLLTRRLWLCVGLHWGWNLFQALYSVAVSGVDTKGLLNGHVTGPAWLTGGSFGVEASLLTVLLSLITASYLLYIAHKKGRFIAPYWR
jgi:membrane protease YdiL (CAAX protease family)